MVKFSFRELKGGGVNVCNVLDIVPNYSNYLINYVVYVTINKVL